MAANLDDKENGWQHYIGPEMPVVKGDTTVWKSVRGTKHDLKVHMNA